MVPWAEGPLSMQRKVTRAEARNQQPVKHQEKIPREIEETISEEREGIGVKKMGIEDGDDFLDGPSSEPWGIIVIPLPLGGSLGPDSAIKSLSWCWTHIYSQHAAGFLAFLLQAVGFVSSSNMVQHYPGRYFCTSMF